jgi:hypothetical protein
MQPKLREEKFERKEKKKKSEIENSSTHTIWLRENQLEGG